MSRGSLFWSASHTSIDENCVFIVLRIVNKCVDILIKCPNCLFGTKVNNTFDAYQWLLFTRLQCTKTTSTNSNFSTSPSLSWLTSFFVLPNSFVVSDDNNSNLYPVFTLKTILFLILFG